jgi:SAM-dependent methyltransferase
MADVIRPYIGNRVLEVGAGTGNMSVHLMPRAIYWATDINPHYLDYLATLRATRPYLRVAYTNATDPGSFPKGQTFDTVVCLNVVEHVDQDVTALRNIWESLDEGGRAIVLVPCGPELFGTLDEILGHVRRYTEAGLIEVATQAGFQVERLLKFNRAGVLGWWLNGRVLRKKTFDLGQIRMLNILTPLFRLLEPVLPLPPLSLIAILRKEASRPGFSESTTASAASSVKL